MKIHFIAVGGAIMHNLAICLQNLGHEVSGSDDIIFDPAKSNLEKAGILPKEIGFFEENIHSNIDAIILGMHAKKDNVELKKAQELGITVYSFPEFIYKESINKTRIVVGGSHGKTTTTAMIMHVMKQLNYHFDYLVGSSLQGFPLSVQLTDAPYIVLEGDEYLSSPIELTSKFHYYHPQIAILTGIAWDHVNVFPTWESYVKTFDDFLGNLAADSKAILFQKDVTLQQIALNKNCDILWYETPSYVIEDEKTFYVLDGQKYPLAIFGKHNLENMTAAMLACEAIGIQAHDFLKAMGSFQGTARRLEKIALNNDVIAFKDFAHSPSKLTATLQSVKEQFATKKIIACMELHTFSSTDPQFLDEYKGSMLSADLAIIYMSDKAFEIKGKAAISNETIVNAFQQENVIIARKPAALLAILTNEWSEDAVYLLMSSGNFDGVDWKQFFEK
jgi:UDP-N-acetylmuramate: L-alanyl-gamma-D-glutamyl-meso-diaminopimelate ligase